MSAQDRESILKKIRALAELANPENNPFPAEVAAAAAKMQALMDEYNVSMADVIITQTEKEVGFTSATCEIIFGQLKTWHWGLARAIARITGTRHYASGRWGYTARELYAQKNDEKRKKSRGHSMAFFGLPEAVKLACELFDKWAVRIDEMAVKATSDYCEEMQADEFWQEQIEMQGVKQFRHLRGLGDDHPTVWRNSWLAGVVAGIHQALSEQEEAREPKPAESKRPDAIVYGDPIHFEKESKQNVVTALAIVNTAVTKAYVEFAKGFSKAGASHSNTNYSAHSAGVAVGRSLNLTAKELKG